MTRFNLRVHMVACATGVTLASTALSAGFIPDEKRNPSWTFSHTNQDELLPPTWTTSHTNQDRRPPDEPREPEKDERSGSDRSFFSPDRMLALSAADRWLPLQSVPGVDLGEQLLHLAPPQFEHEAAVGVAMHAIPAPGVLAPLLLAGLIHRRRRRGEANAASCSGANSA